MSKGKYLLIGLEFCSFLCALKGIFQKQVESVRKERVEHFFQTKKEYDVMEEAYFISESNQEYIGILEIPKIQLQVGFYEKENVYNSVEYGLEVIKSSRMPDETGNFILASHSGTSSISYFKNLHFIEKGDLVYIYYKNTKYTYQIDSIYEEEKDGSISLPRVESISLLTLTTCKEKKQLVLIAKCIHQQNRE